MAQFATKTASLGMIRTLRQQLPSRLLRQSVMASPPTITFTTTNSLSAGRLWPTATFLGTTSVSSGSPFALSGASGPVSGVTYPDYMFNVYTNVNYGAGSLQWNMSRHVFTFVGTRFNFMVKGISGYMFCKVDGQYVSLTPQTVAQDGNLYYWDFTFASAAAREIEIIAYNQHIGGVYTAALTDTIIPGALKGPKTVIIADSFGEGIGATYLGASSMWVRAMEALGWNNYFIDAVGATGLLQAVAPKLNYRDRFISDVVPLAPDLVIVQGSVNDDLQSSAAMQAQAQALIALGQNYFPNTVFLFTSRMLTSGITATPPAAVANTYAVKSVVQSAGHVFADVMTAPLQSTPLTNTLAASAAQFATSLSVNTVPMIGAHYAFNDGTRFLVKNAVGSGPYTITTDAGGLQAAQLSGAAMTQVGDSPLSGAGKVGATTGWGNSDILVSNDSTHPSQLGHDMWGDLLARQIVTALQAA